MEPVILYVVISEESFIEGAWHYIVLSNGQVILQNNEHSTMFKPFMVVIATADGQDRRAECFATYLCREKPFCFMGCDLELKGAGGFSCHPS